ncbi:four-helix bundle copper-binding protein [Nocardiopsis nanhaiensis]
MSVVGQMLYTHPNDPQGVGRKLRACVEACEQCTQVCAVCADACLAEDSVAGLVSCIRTELDCAELCRTTQRILLRQTAQKDQFVAATVEACAQACERCAEECEKHPGHEHCRVCAEVCRRCAQACRELLASL